MVSSMNRIRLFLGTGGLSLVGGIFSLWFAFQRPMCPNERIIEACNPNLIYLGLGGLASLVGLGLLGLVYWRGQTRRSSPA